MNHREKTRLIRVGNVNIGNQNKVVLQSMTNTKTSNVESTVKQILELEKHGCEIIRVACFNKEDAQAIKKIKEKINIPVIADIHFNYKLGIEAIKNGADKIRLNPGNIKDKKEIKEIIDLCKEKNIPIRIGVNSGSLDKEILEKYDGKVTKEVIVESLKKYIKIFEEQNFYNICISIKTTDLKLFIESNILASKTFNYPIHVGVTEAGPLNKGIIKSSVGLGYLLLNGIGDTIRVSLSDSPVEEIKAEKEILKNCGLYFNVPTIISCPTCGRTEIDIIPIIKEIEKFLENIKSNIKVAIMGCIVNGPGEAKEADIGISCGVNDAVLFKKGKVIKKILKENITEELKKEIIEMLKIED